MRRFGCFLALAWVAALAAGEVVFPFSDAHDWLWQGNGFGEEHGPEHRWLRVYPEEKPVRVWVRSPAARNAELTLPVFIGGGGRYVLSGRFRCPGKGERLLLGYRIYSGYNEDPERNHSHFLGNQEMEIEMPRQPGEWTPFRAEWEFPAEMPCLSCGAKAAPAYLELRLRFEPKNASEMTENLLLELDSLTLSGPGDIRLRPTPEFRLLERRKKREAKQQAAEHREATARRVLAESPGNRFDGTGLAKGQPPAIRSGYNPELTPEERVQANPDFTLRVLQPFASEKELHSRRVGAFRFPDYFTDRRAGLKSTFRVGNFLYGLTDNVGRVELAAFLLVDGSWRTVPGEFSRDTLTAFMPPVVQVAGNVAWFYWSLTGGVDGIRLSDGRRCRLEGLKGRFPQQPLAALGGRLYVIQPDRMSIAVCDSEGGSPRPVPLPPEVFSQPGLKLGGLRSNAAGTALLLELTHGGGTAAVYEFDPEKGTGKRKFQAFDPVQLVSGPLSTLLVPRQEGGSRLLAVDPGPGEPFCSLGSIGPCPGVTKLAGGGRMIPPFALSGRVDYCGVWGGYFLFCQEGALYFLNLEEPSNSLILQQIRGRELHPDRATGKLLLVGSDALYELAPKAGWGNFPKLGEMESMPVFSADGSRLTEIPLRKAVRRVVAESPDDFTAVWEEKGLRFKGARLPFACSLVMELDPAATSQELEFHFSPAKEIPGLQVRDSGGAHDSLNSRGVLRVRSGVATLRFFLPVSEEPVDFTLVKIYGKGRR